MNVRIRTLVSLLALAGALFATGCVASTAPDGEASTEPAPTEAAPAEADPTEAAPDPVIGGKKDATPEQWACYDRCLGAGVNGQTCICICGIFRCEV
jgi:hypothetical protein